MYAFTHFYWLLLLDCGIEGPMNVNEEQDIFVSLFLSWILQTDPFLKENFVGSATHSKYMRRHSGTSAVAICNFM